MLNLPEYRLIAEFGATGGALTSVEYRAVNLLRYVSSTDYLLLACEVVFVIFILYYIIEEFFELKRIGLMPYLSQFWSWVDLLLIVISFICAAFNIYRTISVDKILQGLLKQGDDVYANFDLLSYWQVNFDYAIAITVFIAWIKIFKYVGFNKTMSQLSQTLSRCVGDLVGFAVMFFIVFFAFAQFGYLAFGTQVDDYQNFQSAV
ncbi:unnamed protein product [Protopolystoma xenopodis]|uniref:Polycystin cation channel PKD1/PKD2 domain-containing protein n=1 Tax=Protopolystoma xenopodis TaxID=117903 RepID=A0A448WHE6_9PLAT|nr:unnamed protein product [Protopolystoma xenopodis]